MKKDWREDTNWERLGDVVKRLKRDDDADDAHKDLISAEWRLRQAERGRRKS